VTGGIEACIGRNTVGCTGAATGCGAMFGCEAGWNAAAGSSGALGGITGVLVCIGCAGCIGGIEVFAGIGIGAGWRRGVDGTRSRSSRVNSRIFGGSAGVATPSAEHVSLISLVSQEDSDTPAPRDAISAASRALVERRSSCQGAAGAVMHHTPYANEVEIISLFGTSDRAIDSGLR
jgi:hypothetical protein